MAHRSNATRVTEINTFRRRYREEIALFDYERVRDYVPRDKISGGAKISVTQHSFLIRRYSFNGIFLRLSDRSIEMFERRRNPEEYVRYGECH